ncbi:MAG: hypothetical protein PVJ42_06005 [bacterium]
MKKANPAAGYALLVVLVMLLGLVVYTVARDLSLTDDAVRLAETQIQEVEKKIEKTTQKAKRQQGRIWEGTM